ncbi:hypothetical protein E4U17_001004, partial [Claviceps sp. LM77 group G4]
SLTLVIGGNSIPLLRHHWSKVSSQLLNLLTFGLWSKIGRLTHYAFDAVLSMLMCSSSCTIVGRDK